VETVSVSEMLVSVSPEDSCTLHVSDTVKVKVKHSNYRSGQALRDPEG